MNLTYLRNITSFNFQPNEQRRQERMRREQAEKELEKQRKIEEEKRQKEKEKREKEAREAEEKYRAQKLEDERLREKEKEENRKRAEEVRKRAERAVSASKKTTNNISDEKNTQIRKELESIKAEVNATFKKKETKSEIKSTEKPKLAYSHTAQSMEPVEEQKYVPVKRYGLYVEEEVDNGIQIRSGKLFNFFFSFVFSIIVLISDTSNTVYIEINRLLYCFFLLDKLLLIWFLKFTS